MQVLHEKDGSIVSREIDTDGKSLYIFDFDGTLTGSKSAVTPEMADALRRLLEIHDVAILSSGGYERLRGQLADHVTENSTHRFPNYFLLAPAAGNSVHLYTQRYVWETIHAGEVFSEEEVAGIMDALRESLDAIGYVHPEKVYGELTENIGARIAFSALGQDAPSDEKKAWNASYGGIRFELQKELQRRLPGVSVAVGGSTSVDISLNDKGLGVERIAEVLDTPVSSMLYFGDQLREGGNDYAVFRTGIDAVGVSDPDDTRRAVMRVVAGKE